MENVERIACYIRVSTEEQKLHGISLDAQRDKLQDYADTHQLKIVAWYEDEGVSGRKLIRQRPELQRMLHDAHAGKFDRIIFIKLDRFFRSVAEYHECMKYIDPVLWTATEEKYDLTTANGRAFVNMKLTIAELEADQTGERIKIVNDYKVKTGQALSGSHGQGFAYKVEKIDGVKKVVKDPETAPIVMEIINHYLIHQNKYKTHKYIVKKYNISMTYNVLSRLLKDSRLYGSYRGNDNYIDDPYIDKATFDKLQVTKKRNIKQTAANRTYLFVGLIPCPVCGKLLVGKYTGATKQVRDSGKVYAYERDYSHYRCNQHYMHRSCTFNKTINQEKIEKALLDTFDTFVNATIIEATATDNRANVDNELVNKKIKDINLEMNKIKRMYRKGDMTEAEYDNDMEELKEELKELETQLEPVLERDLIIYEELLKSDWKSLYNALNKENKRAFWRKYLKAIEVDVKGNLVRPIFF